MFLLGGWKRSCYVDYWLHDSNPIIHKFCIMCITFYITCPSNECVKLCQYHGRTCGFLLLFAPQINKYKMQVASKHT